MTNSMTIREHFKRLADFSGREDKASFWPYAGIVFLIVIAVSMAIFIPMTMGAIDEMQKFALNTQTKSPRQDQPPAIKFLSRASIQAS